MIGFCFIDFVSFDEIDKSTASVFPSNQSFGSHSWLKCDVSVSHSEQTNIHKKWRRRYRERQKLINNVNLEVVSLLLDCMLIFMIFAVCIVYLFTFCILAESHTLLMWCQIHLKVCLWEKNACTFQILFEFNHLISPLLIYGTI